MSKAKSPQAVSLFSEVEQKNSKQATKITQITRPRAEFTSATNLFSQYQMSEQNKHIAHEFQSFGCHLAEVLEDKRHTSLYIKLAKTVQRGFLERALSFVIDSTADNKAKLFMWKLGQLQDGTTKQRNSKT